MDVVAPAVDPSIEALMAEEEEVQLQDDLLPEPDLQQASAAHWQQQQQHLEQADHELQYPPLDNAPAERTVMLPSTAVREIVGRRGRNIPTLERELGVSIDARSSADPNGSRTAVTIRGDTGLAVLMAKQSLLEHTASADAVGHFLDLMQIRHWQKLHIFVDYSNILISAQRSTGWPTLQINAGALLQRVVGERDVQGVHVAGSTATAAEAEALKTEWGALSFGGLDGAPVRCTPDFQVRPAAAAETCLNIDDRIVARAATSVAKEYRELQRLVLLTGDGNDNGAGWASFAETCALALNKGWRVEVWAWKSSVSRVYRRLQADYPQHFHLYFLDLYMNEIITVGPSAAPSHTRPARQPAAPAAGRGGRGRCRSFDRGGGCNRGSDCPFLHEAAGSSAPAPGPPAASAPLAAAPGGRGPKRPMCNQPVQWAQNAAAMPPAGTEQQQQLEEDSVDQRLAAQLRDVGKVVVASARAGCSVLESAASMGRHELLREILAAFRTSSDDIAPPDISSDLRAATLAAASKGHPQCLQLLLDSCTSSPSSLAELLDAKDTRGHTPLVQSARQGHVECVRLLLEHSPETQVVAVDASGRNALMHAALKGHTPCVRLLLAHSSHIQAADGVGINATTHQGSTSPDGQMAAPSGRARSALGIASRNAHVECLQLLLAHSPPQQQLDRALLRTGQKMSALRATPADEERRPRFKQCVELLLSNGAMLTAQACEGAIAAIRSIIQGLAARALAPDMASRQAPAATGRKKYKRRASAKEDSAGPLKRARTSC